MRKLLVSLTGMVLFLFLQQAQAQSQKQTWLEDFDGSLPPSGWTVNPSYLWMSDVTYYISQGSSSTNPQSYLGKVPSQTGDSVILTTISYPCTPYQYVYLRFWHICKVSPSDKVRLEYNTDNMGWKPVPATSYKGFAANYGSKGFSAASYTEWKAKDSNAYPQASWWREETFDLRQEAGYGNVQFRFVIQHGSTPGTNASYGWLLENVEVIAADYQIDPPTVQFIAPLVSDTVYGVGPYEINAKVKTNTTAPIVQPWLVWTTSTGVTDSVLMTMVAGDSLWKATIPPYLLGTQVTYSITGRDASGNEATAISGYLITVINGGGFVGYVTVDKWNNGPQGNITSIYNPIMFFYNYGWTKQLYLASELTSASTGGMITELAWDYAAIARIQNGQSCYFKAVDDANIVYTNMSPYDNPATNGATLVYQGNFSVPNGRAWVNVPLIQPFLLPPGKNLMIYWQSQYNSWSSSYNFYCHSTSSTYLTTYEGNDSYFPTGSGSASTYGPTYNRPNARFYIIGPKYDSNSVALSKILTPTQSTIVGGQSTPVTITIKNKGSKDLKTCTINWRLNGVLMPPSPYPYTGNLPWGFEDTLVLGNYTAKLGGYDTIVVWVSMPNGQYDSVTFDDTVKLILYGCAGPLAGNYTIGSGGNFPTINDAINLIKLCGAGADVRLLLPAGTYTQGWDYRNTDFSTLMGGHILYIASASGSRDVVVNTSSTYPLWLGTTKNIGFDGIVFFAKTGGNNAVYISGPCTNIVINNCSIMGDTTNFSYAPPLYFNLWSNTVDNFRITNCLINGGYMNVELYGGGGISQGSFSTNIVMDSNIFRNSSRVGMDCNYAHFKSFSYNKIQNRGYHYGYSNSNRDNMWDGVRIYYCNIENMVGNTFVQIVDNNVWSDPYSYTQTPCGIRAGMGLNQLNVANPKPALIANNEIRFPYISGDYNSSVRSVGIFIQNSGAPNAPIYILHNSIYMGYLGYDYYSEERGICTYGWSGMHVIKKNLIHTSGQNSYPISFYNPWQWNYYGSCFDANFVDIDSNNYYSPYYLAQEPWCYMGSFSLYDMYDWQQYATTDQHSTTIDPDYIDFNVNLELNDYSNFTCVLDRRVKDDIQRTKRGGRTSWGCYDGDVALQTDAMLTDILGMKPARQASAGQKDSVYVELMNAGKDPIIAATICWKHNGVTQTPISWNGNLDMGDVARIFLFAITYGYGNNEVEASICGLGLQTDLDHTNDTARYNAYVCQAPMSGTYTIGGATGPRNFANFANFVSSLDSCGATGSLRLEFSGTHNGINFQQIADLLNGVPVTIAGAAGISDMLYASYGDAITIGNKNRNITFDNITIKADNGNCVSIAAGTRNITIRKCNLLNDATGYAGWGYSCIYTEMPDYGSPPSDSIVMVKNVLNGGYYNAMLYGTYDYYNTPYPSRIIFDSNSCINAYQYGLYMYYNNVNIRYNQISNRTSGDMTSGWSAIRAGYCNGNIVGNRITANPSSTPITEAAIYIDWANFNYRYPAASTVMVPFNVINNEIRYLGNNYPDYTGSIYIDRCGFTGYPINIVHNSIYVESGSSSTHGIYIGNMGLQHQASIKNNNICMLATNAHPIYLSFLYGGTFNTTIFDVDANNMYAPTYVGYANGDHTTIPAWQGVVTTDQNSVSVLPTYINTANNLKTTTAASLLCPGAGVTNDIDGSIRGTQTTTMGCYEMMVLIPLNASLANIVGLRDGTVSGQTDTVKVVVSNTGITQPITSISLGWSVSGTQKNVVNYNFSPPLAIGQSKTIILGTITYVPGYTNVIVWINGLNNAGPDNYRNDDTISKTVQICSGTYSGTYTVGPSSSSNFKTIKEAYTTFNLCGVVGNITLAFESGIYTEDVSIVNSAAIFKNYKLTVTSAAGNADSVILRPASGSGITLGNAKNSTIKAITVDVSAQTVPVPAIQFTGPCTNILIRDCKLLGDPTSTNTSSTNAVVYKDYGKGRCDSISFIHNLIDGGEYGMFIFETGSSSTGYGTNFVIDSNIISNQYEQPVYLIYVDCKSFSGNQVLSRTTNVSSYWYCVGFDNCNVYRIVNNRIIQRSTSIDYPEGIMFFYLNYYQNNSVNSLIANNEIILSSTSGGNDGIYGSYSNANIYHNSIYISGDDNNGINQYYSNFDIKNNMIVMTDNGSYPIFKNDGGTITSDYNNLYSPTYVGYFGGSISTIAAWQAAVPSDLHSVQVPVNFVDPTTSLALTSTSYDDNALRCPSMTSINYDINGRMRRISPAFTTMGAYERPPTGQDLMILRVKLSDNEVVNNMPLPISVDVLNLGAVTINNATFGWSVNGNVKPSFSYSFPTPLGSEEQRNVPIATHTVSGNIGDIQNVVVWVESVNNQSDSVKWNDTASTSYTIIPLATFTEPFVADTVTELSFDVYAKIFDKTGAPVANPLKMYIHATFGTCLDLYDTVTVKYNTSSGKWVATIPPQYYGSKVIYELRVSDNVGNNIILKDSTFIQYGGGKVTGGIFQYTGSVQQITLPRGTYTIETWGANGGNSTPGSVELGGTGGYSSGTLTLSAKTTLYVYVGGAGVAKTSTAAVVGGYNGGGNSPLCASGTIGGSGGGATHIASVSGLLSSLSAGNPNIKIVAGGGGGAGNGQPGAGGNGGGATGQIGQNSSNASRNGQGGTQTAGGANGTGGYSNSSTPGLFGQGGTGGIGSNGAAGGGGGGGYYGGGGADDGAPYAGAGGGGSGYIGGVTAGVTAQPTEVGFVPNPVTTGHGYARITKVGSGGGEVYSFTDLSITELISPIKKDSCESSTMDLIVSLANLGSSDYDFSKDNITIGYEVTAYQVSLKGSLPITTGQLESGDVTDIKVYPNLPIATGNTSIKVWVTSSKDLFRCDDTLTAVYRSVKIGLPIDEIFSGPDIPFEFTSKAEVGKSRWEPYQPDGSFPVQPNTPPGMLRFAGASGSSTVLSTRQIDLANAVNPRLEFWYYQDATLSPNNQTYTDVRIVVDNVTRKTIRVNKRGTTTGWVHYTESLTPYITMGQCILIEFYAMNTGPGQAEQYIDRIIISSDQDVVAQEVFVNPKPTACDLQNKDVFVVLRTSTSQGIDFSKTPTGLKVEIPGIGTINYPLTSGYIPGNALDTFKVTTTNKINFTKGMYTLKAYLTTSVDAVPWNDTARLSININPNIQIITETSSSDQACLAKMMPVDQTLVIKNTGNMDVSDIDIEMQVQDNPPQIRYYTINNTLHPGETSYPPVTLKYYVPTTSTNGTKYDVDIFAYMCDPSVLFADTSIQECIDFGDISIQITKPQDCNNEVVGTSKEIEVVVKNEGNVSSYNEVIITALLVNAAGEPISSLFQESISPLNFGDSITHLFASKYNVPNESMYYVKVFINSQDVYHDNDTARKACYPDDVGIKMSTFDKFALGQNTPNPAKHTTRIEYSVPSSGEVVFTVHSVSGQVLYTKTIQSEQGKQFIDLNTNDFAAGVYFYSMEYKGQKLVKRMSVRN